VVSAVGEFAAKLARLTEQSFLEQLSTRMAERSLDLIDQGYQRREDPYGNAWATTKQKNPILEKSGDFRREWEVKRADVRGFTVASDVEYGSFHQSGTGRMVARKTVPDEGGGLGRWEEPLDRQAVDVVLEALK
jgi:phage gpG-like protein